MIIGHGDIASAIIDREDVTFFASGVSNSACIDVNEYSKELVLLDSMPRGKHIVYFSSLCIYYSHSMYADHKAGIEREIKKWFDAYTIIRLGNISWGKNPHTLINYLKAHPEAEIQKVYRHIVDKKEFQYWLSMIRVGEKDIMNVPGKMVWVPDLAFSLNINAQINAAKKLLQCEEQRMGFQLAPLRDVDVEKLKKTMDELDKKYGKGKW